MAVFDPRSLAEPIVQAPLAGGPSTAQLAIAVSEAGGLGFIAAGYKSSDAVAGEIDQVRAGTDAPFGVNLFVPSAHSADPARLREYMKELEPEAARQGAELGEARADDDAWIRKLELVCEHQVPVVSFTFGCPPADAVDRVHRAGGAVWITINSPEEAARAAEAGADAVVAQGIEAGGHRGGFTDDEQAGGWGLLALLRVVSRELGVAVIASGAVADGAAVAAVLCAGASAAQVGTALMLVPEAGTSDAHREALAEPAATALTRAFTGRLARGIVNRFLREHSATAPAAYPEIHHVTSGLRAAARKRGDADAINLWAGQAHVLAESRPAAEIVKSMGEDARRVIQELHRRMTPESGV
jgi:nitronate monooxygenase